MLRKNWARLVGGAVLLGLVLVPVAAFAHETVTAGDYSVEYGWLSEPAVVGQPNAVVINISKSDEPVDIDPSQLIVEAQYGGQTKTLELQPLSEDSTGEYIARLTPTKMGQYTVHLTGSLGDQSIDLSVQPEDIESADVVEFPDVAASSNSTLDATGWLAIVALILGLVGSGFGIAGWVRQK
ncbi:MAG: hypothetical protein WBZ24_12315 [Anaerolineales bacterium]